METQEVRWRQRLDSYLKALARMNEASVKVSALMLVGEDTELMRDGLIQRYEFTLELAWKLMKDYLEYMGIEGMVGPKGTIHHALQNGLIDDDRWMDSVNDRNLTSHVYKEEVANDIAFKIINVYGGLFNRFADTMKRKGEEA